MQRHNKTTRMATPRSRRAAVRVVVKHARRSGAERDMSAVFSVRLEGMCSICNWDREKWFVLGCTTAFMNPRLMRALDKFRALQVCLCLNVGSAHKAISHITSACSMILLEGVCFRSGAAGKHSSLTLSLYLSAWMRLGKAKRRDGVRLCSNSANDYYHYGIKAYCSICCCSSLFVHTNALQKSFFLARH